MSTRPMRCRNCGSSNLQRDAVAGWNNQTLEWEHIDVYDDAIWCNDCGTHGWSNIEEYWPNRQTVPR